MQNLFVPEVALKRMDGFRVAFVRHRGPPGEIGAAFLRLLRLLRERRVRSAGPMIALREATPPISGSSDGDAAAVPVPAAVRGDVELSVMDLPPCEVASLMFEGTPARVGESYRLLDAWIESNGLIRCGTIREIYTRDLSELPPGVVYMEIQVPVRPKRRLRSSGRQSAEAGAGRERLLGRSR